MNLGSDLIFPLYRGKESQEVGNVEETKKWHLYSPCKYVSYNLFVCGDWRGFPFFFRSPFGGRKNIIRALAEIKIVYSQPAL